MANSNAPTLPPPNPEHRRVASGKFERANQVVATGNYDYGIHLLLDCCRLDPANLVYRQALRRTEKAKYRNNLRGSRLAWLTTWPALARLRRAHRADDYLKVLVYGEQVLMRNPWHIGAQVSMAEAAEAIGLLDLAVWTLEQARQKNARDLTVNRALALLYEKRGNFSQAAALWALVRKVKPDDNEAVDKIRALAVHDTIARGNFEGAIGGQAGQPAAEPSSSEVMRALPSAPGRSASTPTLDRVSREVAALRPRLEADPTNAGLYLQLAAVHRRADQFDQARAVLREAMGPTGNAFEVMLELLDLEIETFRRNLTITEEKLKAQPDDAHLKKLRARLHKEINTRELDLYRRKADRFPTELNHRHEVGVRLLRAGQIDEAIRELQAARADPRCRWKALQHLGHCFKARNNWRLAQRNYEEALQAMPASESSARKELRYDLAQGCAAAGDLPRAVEVALELANEDFSYRDISRLLDEWQARVPH